MAGFEVIIYGRCWVITEGRDIFVPFGNVICQIPVPRVVHVTLI